MVNLSPVARQLVNNPLKNVPTTREQILAATKKPPIRALLRAQFTLS